MGGRNRITDMAFLRKRASGDYALAWKWKGKPYFKGLGIKDLAEAERIRQDAVDQLARIRSGESDLASKPYLLFAPRFARKPLWRPTHAAGHAVTLDQAQHGIERFRRAGGQGPR